MPALEMAQETGKLVRWFKRDGDAVIKGEPIMEIETDKVTVEIEASASGVLGGTRAREGDTVPVGQTIAWILAPGESLPAGASVAESTATGRSRGGDGSAPSMSSRVSDVNVSPVARRIAEEHGIDVSLVKPNGGRVEKADVLAYLQDRPQGPQAETMARAVRAGATLPSRLIPASPKARRLAAERGINLATLRGFGPGGAVLAADVPVALAESAASAGEVENIGTVWRVMAERMTVSWTSVPHFYLMREVLANGMAEMRARITSAIEKRTGVKPTYTDLLVKSVAVALRDHPRLNASWADGDIQLNREINIGIATAIEDGLIVPIIHNADIATLSEIAVKRTDLVARANASKLRPADIAGGTFTITNLGMYHVDAFNAIVNAPQAAILAVGRIADRVVPVDGQPAVRPMMILTLSCDHRVVDGARAAKFLDDLANLIEEPWGLLA